MMRIWLNLSSHRILNKKGKCKGKDVAKVNNDCKSKRTNTGLGGETVRMIENWQFDMYKAAFMQEEEE